MQKKRLLKLFFALCFGVSVAVFLIITKPVKAAPSEFKGKYVVVKSPYTSKRSKYSYEQVYKQLLTNFKVGKEKHPYTKIIKEFPHFYKEEGLCDFLKVYNSMLPLNKKLNCQRLKIILDDQVEKFNQITGVSLLPANKTTQKVYLHLIFIWNEKRVKRYIDSPLGRKLLKGEKQRRKQFEHISQRLVFENKVTNLYREDLYLNDNGKQYFLSNYQVPLIAPLNAKPSIKNFKEHLSEEEFRAIFINVLFFCYTRFASASVVKESIASPRKDGFISSRLSRFDIAVLKAIYSTDITYGHDRKNAAKITTRNIFKYIDK